MIGYSSEADYVPKLADWGYRVTICVAGLSDWRKKIIIVSDLKASLGAFAADFVAPKSVSIWRGWIVMYAGDDVEQVPFIISRAKEILFKKKKVIPQDIAFAVHRAYGDQLSLMIESQVLRRYGYTSTTFRNQAKKQCTASVYNMLCNRIANVKLSLRFLLVGFDVDGSGHIFVAGGESPPTDYTSLGFFAIGSGANAALSSLLFHKSKKRMLADIPETRCAYLLCESKFMAEPGDIGRGTFICLLQPPGKGGFRFVTEVEEIRKMWESEGAPRLPDTLDKRMEPLLRTSDDILISVFGETKKPRR